MNSPFERAVPLVRAEDIPLPRRLLAFALILLGYIFYSYAWNTVDVLRPYIRAASGQIGRAHV